MAQVVQQHQLAEILEAGVDKVSTSITIETDADFISANDNAKSVRRNLQRINRGAMHLTAFYLKALRIFFSNLVISPRACSPPIECFKRLPKPAT